VKCKGNATPAVLAHGYEREKGRSTLLHHSRGGGGGGEKLSIPLLAWGKNKINGVGEKRDLDTLLAWGGTSERHVKGGRPRQPEEGGGTDPSSPPKEPGELLPSSGRA